MNRASTSLADAAPAGSSPEQWRAVFDALDDAVFVHDARTGGIVDVNPAACELFGWSPSEFRGRTAGDISSGEPPFTQRDARRWVSLASRQGPQRFEWLYRDRGGRLFWTEVSLRRAAIAGQDRVLACVRDISDRKRAEEDLRRSEERFRKIADATRDMIQLVDRTGRIRFVNPAAERLLGYPVEDLLDRPVETLIHPEDRERSLAARESTCRGEESKPIEIRLVKADGSLHEVEVSSFRVSTGDGELCVGAILRDVAERLAAERERAAMEREHRRSQALEAIGRLAGGVAHDFNNLLGSILGCVYVARLAVGERGGGAAELDRIQALCKRGGDLTRQLLTVARPRPGRKEVLDVGAAVEGVRALLERTLPRNIRVEAGVEEGLPPARADRSLLTTVLLNLALNARDAMPAGGVLRVRGRRHREEAGREWVDLEVSDSGPGVSEEIRDRIFDPFLSMGPGRTGTGLGFPTAQASVRRWGGDILVTSVPGRGSTLTIRLPAVSSRRSTAAGHRASVPPDHPLTAGAVLLVEDEEDVGRLLAGALEDHGYRTVRARTGLEALERLQEHPEGFGLVVLDLILPELGGEQVYRVLQGLAPEMPVLVVSGREDLALGLAPGSRCLGKPFDAEQFLRSVAGALRGAS